MPLLWAGAPVLDAYGVMVQGAFGSRFASTETLARATPLVLTGLAAAVAFRARLWNIGAEGQLYARRPRRGRRSAPARSTCPAGLLLPLILAAGAAGRRPADARARPCSRPRFGVDEVVTTLLLNFVVLLFVSMMLEGPMQDPLGMGWPQSAPILDAAALPKLIAAHPRPCRAGHRASSPRSWSG